MVAGVGYVLLVPSAMAAGAPGGSETPASISLGIVATGAGVMGLGVGMASFATLATTRELRNRGRRATDVGIGLAGTGAVMFGGMVVLAWATSIHPVPLVVVGSVGALLVPIGLGTQLFTTQLAVGRHVREKQISWQPTVVSQSPGVAIRLR